MPILELPFPGSDSVAWWHLIASFCGATSIQLLIQDEATGCQKSDPRLKVGFSESKAESKAETTAQEGNEGAFRMNYKNCCQFLIFQNFKGAQKEVYVRSSKARKHLTLSLQIWLQCLSRFMQKSIIIAGLLPLRQCLLAHGAFCLPMKKMASCQ